MHPVIHAPSAAIRTLVRLVAGCLLLPLLVGCGSPTVEVVLPSDASTATGASAICRGVVAGEVTSVQDDSQRVATVTLDSTHLADVLMREGVKAWVLDSGGIEFDVSGVAEGAKALPSGSRIVAERRDRLGQRRRQHAPRHLLQQQAALHRDVVDGGDVVVGHPQTERGQLRTEGGIERHHQRILRMPPVRLVR